MKNKSYLLLALSFTLLASSGCAALTRYKCNREYAAKKGLEDAESGRVSQPAKFDGSSCEGEYSASTYTKDYQFGFEQKKKEVCNVANAKTLGRVDGEQGLSAMPQKAKLSPLCDDISHASLTKEYDKAFQNSFCSASRAAQLGTNQGASMQNADGFDASFQICTAAQKTSLSKNYTAAYKKALANACTADGATNSGKSDAAAKKAKEDGLARLASCSTVSKTNLKDLYEQAFNTEKKKMDDAEAVRVAQEQERIRQQKIAEFERGTAVASFQHNMRNYVSRCSVAKDISSVQIDVENQYPEQVMIQGNWRVSYFNNDFSKITEDRTVEATLIMGNSKKSFQKLTLPRDARFCRAEYLGNG